VLNVARGGDLVQHLPEVVGDERHKHTPGVFADHDVRVEPESRLGGLLGERAPVKSHHHQGYGRVGEGLREVAWATTGPSRRSRTRPSASRSACCGNPEAGEDRALFEALVEQARAYREERRSTTPEGARRATHAPRACDASRASGGRRR
jgi:hypothetical protein